MHAVYADLFCIIQCNLGSVCLNVVSSGNEPATMDIEEEADEKRQAEHDSQNHTDDDSDDETWKTNGEYKCGRSGERNDSGATSQLRPFIRATYIVHNISFSILRIPLTMSSF